MDLFNYQNKINDQYQSRNSNDISNNSNTNSNSNPTDREAKIDQVNYSKRPICITYTNLFVFNI